MRALFLTVSALALAGCAVGPDYHPPRLDAPEHFASEDALATRNATLATPADTNPTAPPADARWFDRFGDPLLSRFVTTALAQNLDIAQATARLTQSRAALRLANAALLPSGGINAQAADAQLSRQTLTGKLASNSPGFNRNVQSYEADLGASWEIDLFGGLSRGREAARDEWQATHADVAGVRLAIAAQTADTYITIRGLQERLAIAHEQRDTQQRLVGVIEARYRQGLAAELELEQARGALAQVDAGIPLLENAMSSAMNALDVLLGVQPGTNRALLATAAPVPAAPSIDAAGGPASLIRRRPDLIAAERRLAAANARIGVAVAEYYPKFSLSGLMGTATTGFSGLFSSASNQGQIGGGLRWRLFDFGRIDADIAAARGGYAQALAGYRQSVLRASEDVEDAFTAVVKREAQAKALAGGEAQLTRARDTSLVAYKGGVISLIEVLDADRRLLDVRDARAQARTEAARAAVASYRALGGGWDAVTPTAS